jgi:ubiquinone biosynthesis protein
MKKKNDRERIKEIASVFIKHGIKDGLKLINDPSKTRMAMEELGPTFIKIGQILSTRPDILPEPFIREFRKFQDDVKPEKFSDIRSIVENEFGASLEDVFSSFGESPVAAASLSQVHCAVLRDGKKVAVKVQRPGVRETMTSDISILKRLIIFMKLTPHSQVISPKEIIEELSSSARKELDFLIEAANIKKFSENNKDVKFIKTLHVYEEYCTSNILVMEFIDGIKIRDIQKLELEGYELSDIALKLGYNYIKQVIEDGFFHADPHPGNIFVTGNQITYLDFGITGSLDKTMKDRFGNFLNGIASRDPDAMMRALLKIGKKRGKVETRKLYSDIEQVYNNYATQSLQDIDIMLLMDEIFTTCRKNNIAMPREIAMLFKGLVTIEGVLSELAPEISIMDIAVPYIRSHILREKDYRKEILEYLDSFHSFTRMGLKLPARLLEVMNSMLAGKLKVQMEHKNLESSIGELHKMVNRLIFGILIASFIVGSSLVIRADVGPKIMEISAIGFVGYVGAAVMGIWLFISILRSSKR